MGKYRSFSIFQNVNKADLILEPSPHLIIKGCLDEELYNDLSDNFPTDKEFQEIIKGKFPGDFKSENIRLSLYSYIALNSNRKVSKVWVDFIKYHTSKSFIEEFKDLFGDYVYEYYPELKKKFIKLDNLNEGVRFDSSHNKNGLNMECQICVNTPSSKKSSVIEPHTDAGKELYAGLLYFRNSDDSSDGGDLVVHRWKNNKKKKFIHGAMVKKDLIEDSNIIKYDKNTLVFFLNTVDFIHSVSPRNPSIYSRRFVNILADLPSEDLTDNLLYPKSYAWGKHKFKLLLRSLLIKFGILNFIKKFFKYIFKSI